MARSLASRREAATDWVINWQSEIDDLIRRLEQAVSHRDWDTAARMTGQLKVVAGKRFPALYKVIDALADEDAL